MARYTIDTIDSVKFLEKSIEDKIFSWAVKGMHFRLKTEKHRECHKAIWYAFLMSTNAISCSISLKCYLNALSDVSPSDAKWKILWYIFSCKTGIFAFKSPEEVCMYIDLHS